MDGGVETYVGDDDRLVVPVVLVAFVLFDTDVGFANTVNESTASDADGSSPVAFSVTLYVPGFVVPDTLTDIVPLYGGSA